MNMSPKEKVIVDFLSKAGMQCDNFEDLDGLQIPRENLLNMSNYEKAKENIPELKKLFSSSYLTSLQSSATKTQKWPLINLIRQILRSSGIKPVKLPPRSPDLNPYAERFVKSVKSECLNYLILSSAEQLEYVLKNYCDYYHHERIHQSLGRIIEPIHRIDNSAEIACIERLGGLLKSYHRLAA